MTRQRNEIEAQPGIEYDSLEAVNVIYAHLPDGKIDRVNSRLEYVVNNRRSDGTVANSVRVNVEIDEFNQNMLDATKFQRRWCMNHAESKGYIGAGTDLDNE